jgi:hypothetical protein
MKKLFFIASITLVVGLTSCKKDHNCTCSYPAVSGIPSETILIPNSSKGDAQNACDTYNAVALLSSGSCNLN